MFIHHTIANGFVPENDAPTKAGLDAARAKIGADACKLGYSEARCATFREEIAASKGTLLEVLKGKFIGIEPATTRDAKGNEYPKARVFLRDASGVVQIFSGDIDAEFTQRLLAKLEGVTPDSAITISCKAEVVTRDGREFINHYAFVADAHGQEVKAPVNHFGAAAEKAKAKEEGLRAIGVADKKTINQVKFAAKTEHFAGLLAELAKRFTKQATPVAA